jgi:hypothetical protein
MTDEELLELAESKLKEAVDDDELIKVAASFAQQSMAASLLVIARSLKKPPIDKWVPTYRPPAEPEHKGADAIGKAVEQPNLNPPRRITKG